MIKYQTSFKIILLLFNNYCYIVYKIINFNIAQLLLAMTLIAFFITIYYYINRRSSLIYFLFLS